MTRLSAIRVIAGLEARAAARGLGGYVALGVAVAAAAWLLLLDVWELRDSGIVIRSDPFRAPLAAVLMIVPTYLGLLAATSVARDRESGTLEVLFYGPVDEISYVLGKIGGLLLAYAGALPVLLVCFLMLSRITGFGFNATLPASLLLSPVSTAVIVGFGVLLAVGTDRVRSAVLLFVASVAFLVGTTIAYRMVTLTPIDDPASPLLSLRDGLASIDAVARRLSPFASLERIVASAANGVWRESLLNLAGAGASSAALILLAAWRLRRCGVFRRGE